MSDESDLHPFFGILYFAFEHEAQPMTVKSGPPTLLLVQIGCNLCRAPASDYCIIALFMYAKLSAVGIGKVFSCS